MLDNERPLLSVCGHRGSSGRGSSSAKRRKKAPASKKPRWLRLVDFCDPGQKPQMTGLGIEALHRPADLSRRTVPVARLQCDVVSQRWMRRSASHRVAFSTHYRLHPAPIKRAGQPHIFNRSNVAIEGA